MTKAIEDALNSPLLRNSDIRSSKRLLFYMYCNPEAENVVTMAEMNEITQFSANLSKNIGIKWGACWDKSLGEKVKMTILASGFDITIADKKDTEDDVITFGADRPDTRANTAHTVADKKENEDIKSLIASEYGEDKMTSHSQEMARKKYVVLKPSQFDNDEAIAMFDKIPAYNRNASTTEAIRHIGTSKEPYEAVSETTAEPKEADTSGSLKIQF